MASTTRHKLATLLKIRHGEGLAVALLWLHSFFVGSILVFLEAPASALFLTAFDVETLPYLFMATAAATVAIGFLVTWLQRYVEPGVFFLALLAFLFLGTLGFYLGLASAMPGWLVLAFVIWKDIVWTLVVIELWAVAGFILNVRQGKRLFGLLNSGKILSGLGGGLATPLIVSYLGAPHLVLLGLVGLLGAFVSLAMIVRSPSVWPASVEAQAGKSSESGESVEGRPRGWSRDRFLLLFFAVTVIGNLAYYFLEYVFYDQIERTIPDRDRIASFWGLYMGVGQGANLLASALLSGRLLTRFGLSAGLLTVPILAIVGLSAAAASRILPGAGAAFFWCITGTKLAQEVVGSAVELPAARILYQPLNSRIRLRVQTIRESIIEPATVGFAGLLLLILPALLAISAGQLIYVILGIVGVWLVAAIRLRSEYTAALSRALQGRRFRDLDLSLNDSLSLKVLERELENPRPGGIIYCLTTLEELRHPALDRFLTGLLEHPSSTVRTYVLGRIEVLQLDSARQAVLRRLGQEEEPETLGAALRAVCAVTEDGGFDRVLPYLEAPQLDVREGALIGLLRSGGIEGVLAAGTQLIRLIESVDPAQRRFAAHVLGEVGISSFYRPLIQLLGDSDMRVRREALRAAGKLTSPGLIRPLIDNLGVPAVADAAVSSLIAYQDAPLAELETLFRDDETPRSVRSRIVKIAGRLGSEAARTFLKAWLDHPQEDLRYDVLRALVRCQYRAETDELPHLRQVVLFEAADATWTLATRIDLGEETAEIRDALDREVRKNTQRILLLLSFMYPAEDVLRAKMRLESDAVGDRARAIEMLDNLLDAELTPVVLPLVDDLSPRARLMRLGRRFPQERLGREGRLRELITRTSDKSTAWAKACALQAVGRARLHKLESAVVAALEDPDPFLRETAVWALGELRSRELPRHLSRMIHDPSENVARLARWIFEARSPVRVFGGLGYLARSAGFRPGFLERLLADPEEPLARRSRAARILGSLEDPAARQALTKKLSLPEGPLRGAVLAALRPPPSSVDGSGGFEARDRRRLRRGLEHEIDVAASISERLDLMPKGESYARLTAALSDELDAARERILRLLVFLSPGASFAEFEHFFLRHPEERVPAKVAGALRSLFQAIDDQALRQLVRDFVASRRPIRSMALDGEKPQLADVLGDLARDTTLRVWTRACALDLLARLGLPECVPAVLESLDDPEETVREVAYWALSKLAPPVFRHEVRRRGEDPSPRVARCVAQLSSPAVSS